MLHIARLGAVARQCRNGEQRRRGHGQRGSQPGNRTSPATHATNPNDERVQGEKAAHEEQDVDRSGRVEEGAPRGRYRENEARYEEGERAEHEERAQRQGPAGPGQRDQADHGHRSAQEQQHVEQVVGQPLDPQLE